MTSYNQKSCNALEKPFYRPLEAAIRWCGLIDHEPMILSNVPEGEIPKVGQFPQWPCLRANTEKIYHALINDEMPSGRDGRNVSAGDHVAPARRTVTHSALKRWMEATYPDQKPAFLFDEIERSTHTAISAESFRTLQIDRDALKVRIEKAIEEYKKLMEEKNKLEFERNSLKQMVDSFSGSPSDAKEIDGKSETSYLNIIAALVGLSLEKTDPKGVRYSTFKDQQAIINAIGENFGTEGGLSESNLQKKFALAKKSINSK